MNSRSPTLGIPRNILGKVVAVEDMHMLCMTQLGTGFYGLYSIL